MIPLSAHCQHVVETDFNNLNLTYYIRPVERTFCMWALIKAIRYFKIFELLVYLQYIVYLSVNSIIKKVCHDDLCFVIKHLLYLVGASEIGVPGVHILSVCLRMLFKYIHFKYHPLYSNSIAYLPDENVHKNAYIITKTAQTEILPRPLLKPPFPYTSKFKTCLVVEIC